MWLTESFGSCYRNILELKILLEHTILISWIIIIIIFDRFNSLKVSLYSQDMDNYGISTIMLEGPKGCKAKIKLYPRYLENAISSYH